MNPSVSCDQLTVELSGKILLKTISFELQKNENMVIFGPNGAGKTVLLRVLSGNLEPTEGAVAVLGKKLYTDTDYQLKKQIGFVSPQQFNDYAANVKVTEIVLSGLFGSIGVANDQTKDNIKALHKYMNRVIGEKDENVQKAHAMLRELQIVHLKDEIFESLSYGEKVGVLIARAFITHPHLLILDEPTTGLDMQMRAYFSKRIEALSRKAQIIYVTHHIEEILPSFNKVMLLKKGNLFKFGDKKNILTNEYLSMLLDMPITVHEESGRYVVWF